MNKDKDVDGIKIGDKVLRLKEHDFFPDEWIETVVNEAYLPLIAESPQDFRHLNGDEINVHGWKGGMVECDICTNQWLAVRPANLTRLECPNCRQMAQFEELAT